MANASEKAGSIEIFVTKIRLSTLVQLYYMQEWKGGQNAVISVF
jgi:hypothetical protein